MTLSVFVDLVRIPGVRWTEVNFFKNDIQEINLFLTGPGNRYPDTG
jgi:hypothetical protein